MVWDNPHRSAPRVACCRRLDVASDSAAQPAPHPFEAADPDEDEEPADACRQCGRLHGDHRRTPADGQLVRIPALYGTATLRTVNGEWGLFAIQRHSGANDVVQINTDAVEWEPADVS